ncbi:PAAR domain-containing protein [Pseudomonas aeruginosa]|uniref:PAAR domain-containing protein n=1 Tax=Pseudomonas aeruginosa TaxID=287 RepID=UPI001F3E474A|nr:PAAR domain-containing protein [Pseudomonas aeruginosa]MDG3714358.1 PAAR domain-containing protein [Pseudomonas aeruginosa]
MKPIVLVGHQHSCPIHGTGTVVSGASQAKVNGRAVARIGDQISCGAVILTGSPGTIIEGQPAARLGDSTSHGGTLVEGEAGWLIE